MEILSRSELQIVVLNHSKEQKTMCLYKENRHFIFFRDSQNVIKQSANYINISKCLIIIYFVSAY